MTMPRVSDRNRTAKLMLEYVAAHRNHMHLYSSNLVIDSVASHVLLGSIQGRKTKYCSGLVAKTLQYAGILKKTHTSLCLPYHFLPESEHILRFERGFALRPLNYVTLQ